MPPISWLLVTSRMEHVQKTLMSARQVLDVPVMTSVQLTRQRPMGMESEQVAVWSEPERVKFPAGVPQKLTLRHGN